MAFLCYGLLVVAWVVDLITPQLFIVAILFNGPIALSSLALRTRLTTNLVAAAVVGNFIAGFVNGVREGHHWSAVAVGDRFLLAASFILVGYMSVKTQEYAREAGVSAGRMRQVEIERALRGATTRVRETLNVELVQRGIARESVALLGAARAKLVVRDAPFDAPLSFSYEPGTELRVERGALATELASLTARALETDGVVAVTANDLLGRVTLGALGAGEALVTRIPMSGSIKPVLVVSANEGMPFVADAVVALGAFAEQAAMALEQARLFAQLGERNAEIANQKDELANRSDIIRDIVYTLAHDLRTPLAAANVTMHQALANAYGQLPERYREILTTTLAANDDERRIVETLLLVARYEAGEDSTVFERVDCTQLVTQTTGELGPVAEVKGVGLRAELPPQSLFVLGDAHEIRRAIVNLIANALEATPRGGQIVVRGGRVEGAVAIAIEDDGYGLPEARRAGLFQRFGGGQPGAGSGLGLYIVRRIAEKHGGSVAYAPREPRGSAFTMRFPMAPETDGA